MNATEITAELASIEQFFLRSIDCLEDSDADFRPLAGMMSVAEQIAHAAITIEWFIDGVTGSGFSMDFEDDWQKVRSITTLADAKARFVESIKSATSTLTALEPAVLNSALPEGPVLGGMPRWSVVPAIAEHTAHHRGALTVYSRLLGHTPSMPYL